MLACALTTCGSSGETNDMDRDSVERLRFDRRLQRRRDWVAEEDYEAYVESLPDASEKLVRSGEDENEPAGATAAGPEPGSETGWDSAQSGTSSTPS